jgi:hypothetical protein
MAYINILAAFYSVFGWALVFLLAKWDLYPCILSWVLLRLRSAMTIYILKIGRSPQIVCCAQLLICAFD